MEYNPDAWAVITGAISRLVVLDFDGETGEGTRTALKLNPHVKTGAGGSHVYVDHPGWGTTTVTGQSKLTLGEQFPGLDIRGDGGYAIFCGRNESGSYEWVREMQPDPLDTIPSNLRSLLGLLHPPEGGGQQPPASDNNQTNSSDPSLPIFSLAVHLSGPPPGAMMQVFGWPRSCEITVTHGPKPRESYWSSSRVFPP